MKKTNLIAAALTICLLAGINAHSQKSIRIPLSVKQSFENNFKQEAPLKWIQVQDAFVAIVQQNDQTVEAYFTSEGEYKGKGRYVELNFLPMEVQEKIKSYSNYEIQSLYEYDCNAVGTSFYVVLQNAKKKVVTRLNANGEVIFSETTRIRCKTPATDSLAIAKKN